MTFEEWLSEIIEDRSINLSKMARALNLSYKAIYNNLSKNGTGKELRSSEMIAICKYLGVNPMDFK